MQVLLKNHCKHTIIKGNSSGSAVMLCGWGKYPGKGASFLCPNTPWAAGQIIIFMQGGNIMKILRNILIAAIPVLLFAGLFVYSIISKRVPENPPGTTGNTAGNLNNGGLFCEDEGIVYFSNAYDNNSLYSMNPDETDVKKLSNAQVYSINAAGNFLYYYQAASSASDQFSSMFRTKGV